MNDKEIVQLLQSLAVPDKVEGAQRFFKSGAGEYGEGDKFLGVSVPQIRQTVKDCKPLDLSVCVKLMQSPYHEVRMFALLMMVALFSSRNPDLKQQIYNTYMEYRRFINNWDLVDCSCYKIVGPLLIERSRQPLLELAESDNLWDRRIAMVSTYHFIRANDFDTTFKLADILLKDKEDLIHKAVGWMLKEIGKRNKSALVQFLKSRYLTMPRTMLRTAIEKLSKDERNRYLSGSA